MGREAKLPAGSKVEVAGQTLETLQVGGLGTVGIPGVDAVVSHAVARSLGFPAGNAIVISAPGARLSTLKSRLKAAVPRGAAVEPAGHPGDAGRRRQPGDGAGSAAADQGGLLSPAQVAAFLKAALSRVGMPYVWGAVRADRVRLLRAGAVVVRAGRGRHAAGRRGSGAHRPGRPGQPASAR